MLRRIRALAIAMVLTIIGAVSVGTASWMIWTANGQEVAYKQYSKESAEADAHTAREYVARHCRPLPPPARANCISEQEYAAHQAQHDDRDLEAQRTTAVWTRYLGIAGILGTAFGTVGVVLVLLTFMEQRRTSRAELRAYIDVSKTIIRNDENPSIEVFYTNFGQTPATNVTLWADFLLRSWPITDDPVATTLRKDHGTVPPGHPRRYLYCFIKSEWDAMIANTASFVIPMRITYDFLDGTGSDEFQTCIVVTCDEARWGEGRYLHGLDRIPRPPQGSKNEEAQHG